MLRWTHLAAAVALGHACNYPFLMNNSYGCARDPCAALDAVACAAEATCDMSSVGCATACAALNSSQCMGLAANYTLYYSTFNMDDITYGPLKCSQETVVSDDDLRKMFAAVDSDGSRTMDAEEFQAFIESNALAQVRNTPTLVPLFSAPRRLF